MIYSQEKFEMLCLYCQKYADLIPVTFVLGFYVRYRKYQLDILYRNEKNA